MTVAGFLKSAKKCGCDPPGSAAGVSPWGGVTGTELMAPGLTQRRFPR
jgi:hypothetical protein